MLTNLFLWWHFPFDTNAVIFLSTFPLSSTLLHLQVAQEPARAPCSFTENEQCCLWLKQKPLIVSQVSYLCQDMQLMLGGLPTQTYSIVLSPEEARSFTDSRLTRIHLHTHTHTQTKGQVVLLHPATRGCRQCAPITPGFSPRFL